MRTLCIVPIFVFELKRIPTIYLPNFTRQFIFRAGIQFNSIKCDLIASPNQFLSIKGIKPYEITNNYQIFMWCCNRTDKIINGSFVAYFALARIQDVTLTTSNYENIFII